MATRRYRAPKVFVRRASASHTWEVAEQDTTCELHQGQVSRGALLAIKYPGRVVACEPCAALHWHLRPPEGTTDLWTGPDGRALQLPEHDR